jgi:hypothetical protein
MEFNLAIVLDIILDSSHPVFKNHKIGANSDVWPSDSFDMIPDSKDPDYTWIGRALIRIVGFQKELEKEALVWALPLDNGLFEYPLINEPVLAVKRLNKIFYTQRMNIKNFINSSADFNLEILYGGYSKSSNGQFESRGNRELQFNNNPVLTDFEGPISKLSAQDRFGYAGAIGRYFLFNKNIRSIRKYEGDTVLESRFGQSIRFSAYDAIRDNDKGYAPENAGYSDYKGDGSINKFSSKESGGGNPMILIRNRQRPLVKAGTSVKLHEKLPAINYTEAEKNVGGYIDEDINNDGSSIHITSGVTVSKFISTCYKQMFESGKEEQRAFSPAESSLFKYPTLWGDQVVINSDRLIFSSRFGESFHFSKKRYGIVTDSEFTVDAHNQIVLTTNNKTVINSPAIYLGEYNVTDEPALLGQTTVNWLYDLCQWLLKHTHWYKHFHPKTGGPSPDKTQIPVEVQSLIQLRDRLSTLMSKRVFVSGGGFAPGKDGGTIKDGDAPVKIDVSSGNGVPGEWKGKNRR